MKILVACEESQAVTKEFRKLGHDAFSCDILPCSGGHPEWHIQQDVTELLKQEWDMMIAFPPCTNLAVSGARWFKEKKESGEQQKSIEFFMTLVNAPIKKIAIENPIGIMSTYYRKPDQIIQPWMFGDNESKATCLWLQNIPLLFPTHPKPIKINNSIHRMPPGPERGKLRSKTFPGIAKAMSTQWTFITTNSGVN